MKTTIEILNLASTGTNLVVDASSKTTIDLINIVRKVAIHKGHVTLVNCNNKTTIELTRIAQSAPTNVTIDLS